jgi:phosphohistidine swiveling domain-containing protein
MEATMAFIRFDSASNDTVFAGNKAARLAELREAGFRVPAFFVIGAHAAHELCRTALHTEIGAAAKRLSRHARAFAVRSSSVEEDGSQNSFAGQFDSFLHIAPGNITDHAYKVWDSAHSDRIAAYRESQGRTGEVPLPAVLVQQMVNADVSGVAFSANPVNGDQNTAVVAATSGVGEALVSGACQGDTWHVARNGKIRFRELETESPVLVDRQVRKIAKLVRAVSGHYGTPQDIEWAIEDGRIFLLQSRDITTLSDSNSRDDYALWDNSNIVESYGGVTTPLTFSVARSAYQEAYRHFGRVLGVSEREIARNDRAYEQMIGLIQGRVYYNLLNWYRLLMLTPGFRFNKKFMEQMMGVMDGVPQQALPVAEDDGRFAGLRAMFGLTRVARRLITKLFRHNTRVRKFHSLLDDALQPVDLKSYRLHELLDHYEELEGRVIPAWDTPLINDLYCMIFHGALRALCERWLDEDDAGVHNDLVSGEAGIISLEPVRRMQEMAAMAARKPKFADALRGGSLDLIERFFESNAAFRGHFHSYLERFGDRCLDELKLESQTVADDPLPLLRAVGQLARVANTPAQNAAETDSRALAEAKVNAGLAGAPLRQFIFSVTLKLARARVRDRENLRFERTRVYGRVRAIFVEIGERLRELDVLGDRDDIFYLSAGEISGIVRGTGCSSVLKTLVDCRRREFAAYAASDDPPRRFITRGPAQLAASMQEAPTVAAKLNAESRNGQACSPGIVRGPVRIVRDPRNADIRQGEILVAQRTDPGWVMIFPLLSGMIMERGSLLSHSAIVARELGVPAVVGVEDACRWLQDGDWVELDGATGTIRKLAERERAA